MPWVLSVCMAAPLLLREPAAPWAPPASALELELQGGKCVSYDYKQFTEMFSFPKNCANMEDEMDEDADAESGGGAWKISYKNPRSDVMALYIYPGHDHNSAFSLCSGSRFDPHVCFRMNNMASVYSVTMIRVNSVEEAVAFVQQLPAETKIKHLVLGGHGDPTSVAWGDEDDEDEDTTPEFTVGDEQSKKLLDLLRPHLILEGREHSTVFLDSCLTGKVITTKNMHHFVAHRLAGAEVYASQISFDNKQFYMDNFVNFDGRILQKKKGSNSWKNVMVKLRLPERIRDWHYIHGASCRKKVLNARASATLEACAAACDSAGECTAISWFPDGNKMVSRKCYLSAQCEKTKTSRLGAHLFSRSKVPNPWDDEE